MYAIRSYYVFLVPSRALAVFDRFDLAVLDLDLAEGTGGFTGADQFDRRGALIVDVLAFGDQVEGLAKLARQDLLARSVSYNFV